MGIRRKYNDSDEPIDRPLRVGGSPADPFHQENSKGSLVWSIARFMETLFSHVGMFWLGVTVATVSFVSNVWFYCTLLQNVADFAPWQWLGLALLLASGTTLFEVSPIIWTRGYRNSLHQIFAAAAKPQELPELNGKIVGNAEQLIADYRNSDRHTLHFFQSMRWGSIGLEVFLGVMFLGAIGVGLAALIRLVLFVGSIFGCEWGVSLAIRSAQWELPPQIREQFNNLLSHAGKSLKLKRL